MEFVLSTDLSVLPQAIDFNHEQLKTELSASLERYNSLVVTEDAIKDAKADRATLNKLKTAIEDKRKEVKAQCLKPYDAFAAKVLEIVTLIDKPIGAIDGQIKVFDDLKREEKLAEITETYNNNVGKCAEFLSFAQVFNPKWLNATYKMSDIVNEMMGAFLHVEDDLKAIRAQQSAFEAEMLEEYASSQSLNRALEKSAALTARKAKMEADKLAAQEATARTTAETQAPAPATDSPKPKQPVAAAAPQPATAEHVYTMDFRVHATQAQLDALGAFMRSVDIKYGRVPQEG